MSTQASKFCNEESLPNFHHIHPLSIVDEEMQQGLHLDEKKDEKQPNTCYKQPKGEDISNEAEISTATDASSKTLKEQSGTVKFLGLFEKDISSSIKSFTAPEDDEYYKNTSFIINNISLNESSRSSMLSEYDYKKTANGGGRSQCSGCIII
ncbi:unnamed protein product [Blepharisma stoltei]|uniref:Uncharacterized protein n=1 Tax=Blepharisma stoltei TaxID=1481888 RepID=A0AAU9I8S8_9CILI|nr:unnamed protein product [Blepharisma stoltei]